MVTRTQAAGASSPGELSGPWFDYLIWMALGAPFILVGLLLILAMMGGLNH
jgi:formate hydrogenlyase subunit 3/multisubunit Na+/H+ antiporter MnhD subunit